MSGKGRHYDAIVIGAGLSGLSSALSLADAGLRVGVMAKGGGYLHFTSGCIDVLARDADGNAVGDPLAAIDNLVERKRHHPYALAGQQSLVEGTTIFQQAMKDEGELFGGSLHASTTLPTALGATRTTCLLPETMAAGEMSRREPMLIAGFRQFRDFYPPYVAANLERRAVFPVRHIYLDMPRFDRRHLLSLDLAHAFEDEATRHGVGHKVKANLGSAGRVGLPAVLGLDSHSEVAAHLTEIIGRPIFEIPTLPPSVPGIRIYRALRRRLMRRGVRIEIGFWVRGRIDGRRAVGIELDSAGRPTTHTADAFILATGGTGGGGISASRDGTLQETVFGLAVEGPGPRATWTKSRFLGPESQPISLAGVHVNERLQPFAAPGEAIENIFVVGSNLPGWDPVREGNGEGVALATGYKAAAEVLKIAGRPSIAVQ